MAHGVFVTAINCMDGRTQEPVAAWLKRTFGADYVDTITEPGPDGLLADGRAPEVAAIRRRLEISVRAHGSQVAAVVSHDDCAGNPVGPDQHREHLRQAVERVRSWGLGVRVIGLYVNERWAVEPIVE